MYAYLSDGNPDEVMKDKIGVYYIQIMNLKLS